MKKMKVLCGIVFYQLVVSFLYGVITQAQRNNPAIGLGEVYCHTSGWLQVISVQAALPGLVKAKQASDAH